MRQKYVASFTGYLKAKLVIHKLQVLIIWKIPINYNTHGHREDGLTGFSKYFKTPFFKRYCTPIGPKPRHFFLFEISQQIWLLEASKVLAKMGHSWQANWAMAKIFFSNLRKHVMNICWKFQADISIHIWFRAKWLKNCCNKWTQIAHFWQFCAIWVHW